MHRLTNLAIGTRQMQILLVAGDDEDFAYLRDLLVRAGEEQIALNHAHSFEEALVLLKQTTYDLVLCDYKSADGAALRLLHELREQGLGARSEREQAAVARNLGQTWRMFPAISAAPLRSTAKNASARKRKTPCASFGARWSNPRIW